jgi:hypothetical protein
MLIDESDVLHVLHVLDVCVHVLDVRVRVRHACLVVSKMFIY